MALVRLLRRDLGLGWDVAAARPSSLRRGAVAVLVVPGASALAAQRGRGTFLITAHLIVVVLERSARIRWCP